MLAPAADETEFLQGQNRLLELIALGAPLRQVLDLLLDLIQTRSPGMLCSVLLLDPDGVHVRHASAPALPAEYTAAIDGAAIGPKAGSCGTAMFRREPVVAEDIATDPLWDDYRALALPHGLRACWSTPIFDRQRNVVGSFAMYFRRPGRPDPCHERLIAISTHIASIAITQHRAAEEIRRREIQLVEAQQIANVGSYEWDVRSNRAHRSEELYRIFGLQPEEFDPTYEGYLRRVHPADRAATAATIETAFRDRTPFDFEERIVRPDGSVRILHSRGRWTLDASGAPARLVGTCQDITDRREAEQQLHALSARLINAQEEERIRLARELHDDLSQEIAALSIAAGNLKRTIDRGLPEALELSVRIKDKLAGLGEKVRRLSHSLHPSVLQYACLGAALKSYCSEFTALTGFEIEYRVEGSFEGIPKQTVLCVYRVAQEALQNVLKHSGVKQATVALLASSGEVRLTVSDRGVGMDPARRTSPGLGIVSIRERARLVDGTVVIDSTPGHGTRLQLTVPVPAVA